jgi:hypothetical protein
MIAPLPSRPLTIGTAVLQYIFAYLVALPMFALYELVHHAKLLLRSGKNESELPPGAA